MNLNDLNRKEIIKEFNQNYRSYLENNLIVNLLTDIVINSQAKLTSSSSSTAALDSQKNDPNLQLEDKIRDTFLKSYFILNNSDKNCEEEIKIEPLSLSAKEYLAKQLDGKFNDYLNTIEQFLSFNSFDVELSKNRWHLNDEDFKNNQSNEHDEASEDSIISKFNLLIESINNIENENDKLESEMSIKLEHCLNTSIEIINLIKIVLNDFKLSFYANKNEIECQKTIMTCDLLLTKIETVQNEFLHDLYSPEKQKALSIIKNHIHMENLVSKDKLDQANYTLNTFKSFGSEFESILNTYLDLKSKYEKSQWTLKTLKENSHM